MCTYRGSHSESSTRFVFPQIDLARSDNPNSSAVICSPLPRFDICQQESTTTISHRLPHRCLKNSIDHGTHKNTFPAHFGQALSFPTHHSYRKHFPNATRGCPFTRNGQPLTRESAKHQHNASAEFRQTSFTWVVQNRTNLPKSATQPNHLRPWQPPRPARRRLPRPRCRPRCRAPPVP